MKVDIVIGTRPEAIKMAPVYLRMRTNPLFRVRLISTGQHQELLRQSLEVFKITPEIELQVYEKGQGLEQMNSKILERLGRCFDQDRPDFVLGHGDTTTAFSAALTAFYKNIPFGHVEAGYRTYNIDSPFPEEFNRQAIAKIASIHYPADQQAYENLIQEGIDKANIVVTGQTVQESIGLMGVQDTSVDHLNKQILLTLHRRDRVSGSMEEVFQVVRRVAEKFDNVKFVAPLHPSPRIQSLASKYFYDSKNISVLPPLSYLQFLKNIKRSFCVLTDSGGVQEEANYLGRPALILRDQTERRVGIATGLVRVVGYDQIQITRGIEEYLERGSAFSRNKLCGEFIAPSKIIVNSLCLGGRAC